MTLHWRVSNLDPRNASASNKVIAKKTKITLIEKIYKLKPLEKVADHSRGEPGVKVNSNS